METEKALRTAGGARARAIRIPVPSRRGLSRVRRPQSTTRHNFICTTLEGMATNTAFGLVNPFLGVYAIALGASSFFVGLVTAVPALVNALVFLPAARLVEGKKSRLSTVLLWASMHRLLYLPLGFIAFLPLAPAMKAGALVGIISLMSVPGAIAGVAWTAMVGDMFPEHHRGEVFGLRNMYVGLTGVAGTLAAGYLLDVMAFPGNYVTLFLAATVSACIGMGFMARMREKPAARAPEEHAASLVARVRDLLTDQGYGRKFKFFTLSCLGLWFGFGFTAAMWPIYHVEVLRLPNATIGAFATLAGMATVVSSVYWSRVASRRGNKIVLIACMAGLAAFPASYTLSRSVAYLYALQVVSGFCMGGLNLAVFNLVFEYSRPGRSASAVAVFNALMNASTFVAPFLGDAFYKAFGIPAVFYAGTCVRLASMLLLAGLRERSRPALSRSASRYGRVSTRAREGE